MFPVSLAGIERLPACAQSIRAWSGVASCTLSFCLVAFKDCNWMLCNKSVKGGSSLSCQASYALVTAVATSTCQHRLAESLPMIALHCTAGMLPSRLISSCPQIQWMQQWPNALPQIHV